MSVLNVPFTFSTVNALMLLDGLSGIELAYKIFASTIPKVHIFSPT